MHVNCALWSSEVYEEIDGSLQNVTSALSRGSKLNCSVCSKKGATIGCCHDYCKENYHFPCAIANLSAFKEDKTMYCKKHGPFYKIIPNQTELTAKRIIHVDTEVEIQKRPKNLDLREARVHIGSLTVHHLGDRVKPGVSDGTEALIPIGYYCSREFWSTFDPARKVRYFCKTRLVKKVKREAVSDVNVTINHEEMRPKEVEETLKDTMKKLRSLEVKKMPKNLKIIPPYMVSKVIKDFNLNDIYRKDEIEKHDVTPSKRRRLEPKRVESSQSTPKNMEDLTPSKSLNKAIGNILKRTPSKILDDQDLLAAFQKDFPNSNIINQLMSENQQNTLSHDFEIVQTWFNQKKQMKVTEVKTQCNFPFSRNNWEIDELYDKAHEHENQQNIEIMSDCSVESDNEYEDIIENLDPEQEDVLSYVIEKIAAEKEALEKEQPLEDDFDIIDKILNAPDDVLVSNQKEADICMPLNNQSAAEEVSLPNPIELFKDIPQFDGAADEDNSPKKDFTIAGLLSPPPATPAPTPTPGPAPRRPSDDDVVFIASSGPPPTPVSRQPQPQAAPRHQPFQLPQQQQYLMHPHQNLPPGFMPQATPGVFVQSLPNPHMTAGFTQSFHQQTGRTLQYVASIPAMPFGTAAAIPFMPSAAGLNYLTPQSIIINQPQPTAYHHPQALAHHAFTYQPQAHPQPQFQPMPTPQVSQPRKIARVQPQIHQASSSIVSTMASMQQPSTSRIMASSSHHMERNRQQQLINQAQISKNQSNIGKVDPIKALSSMASHPMTSTAQTTSSSLSISHPAVTASASLNRDQSPSLINPDQKQRSVGTQAKIGAPLKIISPRPWKGSQTPIPPKTPTPMSMTSEPVILSSGLTSAASSRAPSPCVQTPVVKMEKIVDQKPILPVFRPNKRRNSIQEDHGYYCSSPEVNDQALLLDERVVEGIKVKTKQSTKNAIKLVMQKNPHDQRLQVQEMTIHDGSKNQKAYTPQEANKALKTKHSKKKKKALPEAAFMVQLDHKGNVLPIQEQFVNEVLPMDQAPVKIKEEPLSPSAQDNLESDDESEEEIIYEITGEDGYRAVSNDVNKLWLKILEAVQEARMLHQYPPLPVDQHPFGSIGLTMLGLTHSAVTYLIEQLPGAREAAENYKFKHHIHSEPHEILKENPTGCARGEPYKDRKPLDMFSWLASRHRKRPNFYSQSGEIDVQIAAARRATSLDLPYAMRFRHLAKNAKEAVGVYTSVIHGRGLFCKREIQAGEMVIEYAGELIRSMLTDKREKYYDGRGIGCYMFRIDDEIVVDATLRGNAARFINHSCDVSETFFFKFSFVLYHVFHRFR